MKNSFFTPEQISPKKKDPFKMNFKDTYDFSQLLQKDLFQIVSPHVESISDQKRKIITWLKKIPLIERAHILTYTNKEFTCLIRAMYQKKQNQFQTGSLTTFTISHIERTDQFDLMSMTSNKKLSSQYLSAEDELLNNIRIMSRYTQFDSITFSQNWLRNIDSIFYLFDVLGNGISHELTDKDYSRLKILPNSAMFYEPIEQYIYKKATIGAWVTEVFMKHISMKYLEQEIEKQIQNYNQLKERTKQFEKYWKIITPQRKNQIIAKVLKMNTISMKDMFQEHRLMVKVTRNGFPLIAKSDKLPLLLKQILNSNQKDVFNILLYTQISQSLQSHAFFKYYITLELQQEIKHYNQLIQNHSKEDQKSKKMKKKKNKAKNIDKVKLLQTKQQNEVKQHEKQTKIQQKMQAQNQFQQPLHFETEVIENNGTNSRTKSNTNQIIIVKGTDLFYKKLEISQTHEIISIESKCNKDQNKIPTKQELEQQNLKQISKKKKAKTKKKKNHLNREQNLSQISKQKDDINSQNQVPQKTLSVEKAEGQKTNNDISTKIIHADKLSQKSSQTTNDLADYQDQIHDNTNIKTLISKKNAFIDKQQKIYGPLQKILTQLEKKTVFYNKQRKIVINRLSYIFAQHQLSFKLYGSSSCEVALPSSDIDLVVDPSIVNYFYFSYSNYRKKIINSLQYLQKILQKSEWCSDFLLLPGATIPLLTFNVNPNIDFQYEQGNFQYNNKKTLKEQIQISVDITIETYVNMTDEIPLHLGVEATEIIRQWTSIFPFYRQLLLLLKLLTKNHNLNKIYHGGIGSFMQAVILAAFYKVFFTNLNISFNDIEYKKQHLEQIMPQQMNLLQMLKAYCLFISQFHYQTKAMDINSPQTIHLKTQAQSQCQLVILNPLTGSIMSERCILFPQYKKVLQKVLQISNWQNKDKVIQQFQTLFKI